MKYQNEYEALLQHSYFLRATTNLAHDRFQQLEKTMRELGFSEMPTYRDGLTRIQVETAKELGGIKTRMLLDAPQVIAKYHFGPLQVALSLLSAMLTKYNDLTKMSSTFRDNAIDEFCREEQRFVADLEALRNSLLHQRYDNIDEQSKFTERFAGKDNPHILTLLAEGEDTFKDYLRRLLPLLRDGE